MATEKPTRACPYCKEEIKADAVKCKHCSSRLTATTPSHEGMCPFCKEEIHPEAIKCKHCQSKLGVSSRTESDCGCKGGGNDEQEPSYTRSMARMVDDGFGPSSTYRDCQNDCTLALIDCLTTTTNRRSREYCLQRLRWCSLFCGANGGGRSFGGGGTFI
jgi:hypothetical protein